jgi:K+-transporting ATPase ATPase C chain
VITKTERTQTAGGSDTRGVGDHGRPAGSVAFADPASGHEGAIGAELVVALRMTLVTLVLTGLAYPLVMTALSQAVFPWRANGSLVEQDGKVVGSELIGQGFKSPAYFQTRPSAAGADGYDATSSSGSNLGPTSQKLKDRVTADVARLQTENPQAKGPVPGELVTASGSGLDPHISPEAALWQAPRVAAARNVAVADVQALIERRVEARTFGFLGEPRVNVLRLNLDLDERFGRPAASGGK